MTAPLTVLVKSVWGHVPHRKFLHTLSSDHTRFAFATPMASGPIICWRARLLVSHFFASHEAA